MTSHYQLYTAQPMHAETIAGHRYPDLPSDSETVQTYAAWLPQAIRRGLYLGWLIQEEESGARVAGAGLTLLEWGPTKGDPQP